VGRDGQLINIDLYRKEIMPEDINSIILYSSICSLSSYLICQLNAKMFMKRIYSVQSSVANY
jgi:hypothetical protein